jgi:hypothetical protein
MRTKRFLILFTVLGLLAALTTAVYATSSASAAPAAKAVPFKGSWESSEIPTFVPAPPPAATTMYVDGKAWGKATHLGKYTATFAATVHFPCGCSQRDTVHFIAANGDSLYGVGSGAGVPSGTPGFTRVVQTYTITGGTGRFAGAGGTFTVTRLANDATGVSSGSIAGSIVMPTGK